jgi:hypothetical protein
MKMLKLPRFYKIGMECEFLGETCIMDIERFQVDLNKQTIKNHLLKNHAGLKVLDKKISFSFMNFVSVGFSVYEGTKRPYNIFYISDSVFLGPKHDLGFIFISIHLTLVLLIHLFFVMLASNIAESSQEIIYFS